jgi:hypothetical protein
MLDKEYIYKCELLYYVICSMTLLFHLFKFSYFTLALHFLFKWLHYLIFYYSQGLSFTRAKYVEGNRERKTLPQFSVL